MWADGGAKMSTRVIFESIAAGVVTWSFFDLLSTWCFDKDEVGGAFLFTLWVSAIGLSSMNAKTNCSDFKF